MTDKELLELAAKAAGKIIDDGNNWNPLEDDRDALRLAVKLYMNFTLSGKHAAVAGHSGDCVQEYCNGDPYAAARRAIVRAAAEIGKL